MKHSKLVAWGLITSLFLLIVAYVSGEVEPMTTIGVIGFWVFSIWAIVILMSVDTKKEITNII
jgi:hypothetical protein